MNTPTHDTAGTSRPAVPDAPARRSGGRPRRAAAFARRLVRLAVRFEIDMWTNLGRWLLRRPDVPPHGAAFAYREPVLLPILAFFFLSLFEVVAVDLLVPWPWRWLRLLVLALGVWGVVWMLGVLAAVTVRPHVVAPSGLWVRYGSGLDVRIPWDAVAGARHLRAGRDGRTVQVDGDTLYVQVSHQTTVEVALARPVAVALPRGRTAEVTAVRLHADDAAGLVTAVRERVGAGAGR
ncbi:hypothetical protein [Streptomyces macrosporus]|uniref:PH domain-containing protein n=1 Tax=Streptomyces macrosporus TaxID=44032 RepID=A0ABP5X4F0_9ACTN